VLSPMITCFINCFSTKSES